MRTGAAAAVRIGIAALVVAASALGPVRPAAAEDPGGDTSTLTYEGPRFSADYPEPPTQAENQSKLWFYAGAWWALMVDPTGRTLRVNELMPDHTWRPTSAVITDDVGRIGDALRDGRLVHVVTRDSDGSLLYVRLSFDAAAREYRVDPPRLVTTRRSTVPATIAKDAGGTLWAGYATTTNVVVTRSENGGRTWGRVITLSDQGSGQTPEAGALIAFDDRVGMLWSDQGTGTVRFASHKVGDDARVWTQEVAAKGPASADDHISLTRIPGAAADRLVAVVKTSNTDPTAALLELLVRDPDGTWSSKPVSTVAEGLNDPVVQVDVATNRLRVFATRINSIVTKSASLDDLSFPPGIGEIFVNSTDQRLSNPTVSHDVAGQRSGLLVLASDDQGRIYRHAEAALAGPAAQAASDDRTPPSPPTNVQGLVVSPESVVLSWTAANDGNQWVPGEIGVPVAGYVISRDGKKVATVASTSFEDRARSASVATSDASVEYSVVAVDAAGNSSTPVTVSVVLPGSVRSSVPVITAAVLLTLAALLAVAVLLYRRRLARGAGLPSSGQSPPPEDARHLDDEPRARTPVS